MALSVESRISQLIQIGEMPVCQFSDDVYGALPEQKWLHKWANEWRDTCIEPADVVEITQAFASKQQECGSPMGSKAELSKAIQALRTEIDSLEDSDELTRAHLAQLTSLMEAQLDEVPVVDDSSPADTVKDLIETYEARYPRVTAMANDLMTRLAAMGI